MSLRQFWIFRDLTCRVPIYNWNLYFFKSEFSMHSRDGIFCYFRDSKLYKINQAAQNKGTKNEFFLSFFYHFKLNLSGDGINFCISWNKEYGPVGGTTWSWLDVERLQTRPPTIIKTRIFPRREEILGWTFTISKIKKYFTQKSNCHWIIIYLSFSSTLK